VALDTLVAQAGAFHGQAVRVTGFAQFEFEADGLYRSEDAWRRADTKGALWMDLAGAGVRQDTVNQRLVEVDAVVDTSWRGHEGAWAATLRRVTRIQPLERLPPVPPSGYDRGATTQ